MKNIWKVLVFMAVFTPGAGAVFAQVQSMNLDMAILSTASNLTGALERGTSIAVLPVHSQSPEMTNRLTNGLTMELVNMQGFTVTSTAVGARFVMSGNLVPLAGHHRLTVRVVDTNTDAILRVFAVNVQHDAQVASLMGVAAPGAAAGGVVQLPRPAGEMPDHLFSGTVGFGVSGRSFALGLGYERMLNRVSFGCDISVEFGTDIFAIAVGGSFKVFPAPVFFLGTDLGLGFRDGFNASFIPKLGFRLGARTGGFFKDIYAAYPLQIGRSGFSHTFRPGVGIGGSWW